MSKSVDAIIDGFAVEDEMKTGDTTFSFWVPVELKKRHRTLPLHVRRQVAKVMREVAEAVIEKAERKAG